MSSLVAIHGATGFFRVRLLLVNTWGAHPERRNIIKKFGHNMSDEKLYQDEDWLREQYHECGKSQSEVAESAGVTESTIRRWMKEHSIERRTMSEARSEGDIDLYTDPDWLRKQHWDRGKTMVEIGESAGVSGTTIKRWMDKHGLERRSNSEAQSDGDREFYTDADWLREQYWDQEKTVAEISELAGVSGTTIKRWMNRHDIETRSFSEAQTDGDLDPLKDPDWLEDQYWHQGKTLVEIGNELGVTDVTVNAWMERHGIERRDTTSSEVQSDGDIEPLRNPEWLEKQYIENGLSAGEVGEKLGVSKTPVLNHIHEHGIEPHSIAERNSKGNITPLRDVDWLQEQYVEKEMSQYEIADELGVSAPTVRNWLNRHSIEVRSNEFDPDYLSHRVRSTWELTVANLLCDAGVDYEYESLEIEYGDGRIYIPDFVTDDYVIEVKGHIYSNEVEKAEAAMKHLDAREYVVVGRKLPADIHIELEERAALHKLFE